ncbi:MAG TPA: OPT family oligopeptide transporter [Anaeromyxobacteraceae bacterium]|nr:OPT family oligopeptide transporter [Anaeromyxobacteraceae bacterium]
MAIQQLTPEQVRDWTLERKDRWWRENVYRGDMPQLTLRSALTGMLLGGVLSLTNLYVGIRTGWTLGVGITSVILAYSIFKLFDRIGLGSEMTILENNAMQSIATAAGYMTAPLVASIPAYMLVTGRPLPAWHVAPWIVCVAVLGVLFAFPLKKRFINDEQMPFPEGYAAGVVMENLHTGSGVEGLFKAKVLGAGAGLSALIQVLRSEKVMHALRAPFLALPEYLDAVVYRFFTPAIAGVPLRDLDVRLDSSIVMMGTGGLMGVKGGASLLVGGIVNYLVLAPWLVKAGIIHGTGFRHITTWSLWWGVAMMTTASLFSFFSKPAVLLEAFRSLGGGRGKKDVLEDIELPLRVSAWGIPVVGTFVVLMAGWFFGIRWWMAALAIPLVFVFSIIAVTSTGLTAITPGSAMGKLTQLVFGAIAPGNMTTNLMTAGITSDVTLNASNLLMDIKPGYMLGAKPRQQALGHVLGVFAGVSVAVPVYYLLFGGNVTVFTSDAMPMPNAQVFRAVAELLARGLSSLHPTARWAVLVGAVLGIAIEWANLRARRGFPLSGVTLGLAAVVPFPDVFAMAIGSFLFWALEKRLHDPSRWAHRVFVENRETLCAGVIAGGSIIGITLILVETLALR